MRRHGFQRKAIAPPPSLGARLKAARRRKQVSLTVAEQATKIRRHYLEALEEDCPAAIPTSHRKGFARRYRDYLGLGSLILEPEWLAVGEERPSKPLFSPATLPRDHGWVITPRSLMAIVAIVVLLSFIAYVTYQVKQFAAPPTLTLTSPGSESVVTSETVVIEGRTDPGVLISVDNLQVGTGPDGSFRHSLILRPGLNRITIKAVNAIKKESLKTLAVLYQNGFTSTPIPETPPNQP